MSLLAALAVWVVLLVLLGVEFLVAVLPGTSWLPPLIGLAMALLVALTYMRLNRTRGSAAVFAMAGAFWLCVLLGMETVDVATRHDLPAAQRTME